MYRRRTSGGLGRAVLVLLIFVLTGVMGSAVLQAQDNPTPSPVPWVYHSSGQVIYPEAVRFSLVLDRPRSEIARVELTVQPEGRSTISVPINPEDITLSDPYTILVMFWQMPEDNPLPLFTDVTYRWRVVTTRDEVAEIEDHFVWSDLRAQWLQDEDPDGLINLTVPAGTVDPVRLRFNVREIYDFLAANTGQHPTFDLIIYPPQVSQNACESNAAGQPVAISYEDGVELACDPGMSDAILRATGLTPLQVPLAVVGDEDYMALAAHLVDRFYEAGWRDKNVPEWFRIGLTLFYLPTFKPDMLLQVRDADRNNELYTLDGMTVLPDDINSPLWRAQSYGMVVYIADQIGVLGLFNLANNIAQAESFDAAYQSALGQPIAALLPAWKNWIFRPSAAGAFSFTPYQPQTPTPLPPTVTRTLTPVPPTVTFTPTITNTPTITPSVTGVHSPTPLPTRTPVPTKPSPTPSLTPRPPGSLIDTPTPLPTPTLPNPVFNQENGLGFMAALFLVLAVVSSLYLWILRRRG